MLNCTTYEANAKMVSFRFGKYETSKRKITYKP